MSAAGRTARKPYRSSEIRLVMSRCLVKLSLIKYSKVLQIIGRRLIGRYLPGSDHSPSFLKTGTSDEGFQQEGKQDSAKHLLYSLSRTGKSSGEHILKTMGVILSGPVTKQTCNISGMGMAKPLGVMGIEVTTYHDISRGLENK